MNEEHAPMTFNQIKTIAHKLHVPNFDVLDIDEYCNRCANHSEPTRCVVFIPHEHDSNTGHYVGCVTLNNGTIDYQDSYGEHVNAMPQQLRDTGRKFNVSNVKYQSYYSNNCGYLALLHVVTCDTATGKDIDPKVKRW